ncbi:CAMK/CAMKL protein kinase [Allomyces macrogynus ATCC 38327]|uniref:CAMK/CAMKL protein kinase n=1 Tax=Allomyces macrogynus (strain ATCC 38327) TaxID=578462 RepID=A0A0L0SNG5_ALLM3|nr:CAMK/CAMKL protein kinase [Allomyces macrogynus ATCC 38327]|eukprot:KNE64032.1 CAMK/CAMKL protein kinase [Allomyces macrogynus ATCC 38327]
MASSGSAPGSPTKADSGTLRRLSQETKIGDFKIGKTIGQGAFSKVKIGYHRETGQKVAIKIVDKKLMAEKIQKSAKRKEKMKNERDAKKTDAASNSRPTTPAAATGNETTPTPSSPPSLPPSLSKTDSVPIISPISSPLPAPGEAKTLMDSLYAEVKLLMRLSHPNIIGLFQVIDTEDECFIIMEYAPGGELIDYIAAKDHLSEREARRFFRQIISAMDHCHQANVVHRDLKLENLLLSGSRDILITDFGLGRTFRSNSDELMMTFCGTPNYAAVELISFKPYQGVQTDIWAMGVILFIMTSGKPPFHGHSIPSLYGKIMNLQYTCPDHFSSDLRHLLSRILVKDPAQRITMAELLEHPWVNFEEPERPLRIPPLYDTLRDQGMDQILSINMDGHKTIFSFARYQADILSRVVSTNPMAMASRRNSLAADDDPTANGTGSLARRMSFSGRRPSIARSVSPTSPTAPGATATVAGRDPGQRRQSYAFAAPAPPPTALGPIRETAVDKPVHHLTTARTPSPTNAAAIPGARSVDFRRGRRMSYQDPAAATNLGSRQPSVEPMGTLPHSRAQSAGPARMLDPFAVGGAALPGVDPGEVSMPPSQTPTPRRLSIVPIGDSILYNLPSTGAFVTTAEVGTSPAPPSPVPRPVTPTPTTPSTSGLPMAVAPPSPTTAAGAPLQEPSERAIAEFHQMHRPAKSIRSMRFSLTNTNTSSQPPSTIFQELHRGLLLLQRQFPTLKFTRDADLYLFTGRLAPVPRPADSTPSVEAGSTSSPTNALGLAMPSGALEHNQSVASQPQPPSPPVPAASTTAAAAQAANEVVFEAEVCKVTSTRELVSKLELH